MYKHRLQIVYLDYLWLYKMQNAKQKKEENNKRI